MTKVHFKCLKECRLQQNEKNLIDPKKCINTVKKKKKIIENVFQNMYIPVPGGPASKIALPAIFFDLISSTIIPHA